MPKFFFKFKKPYFWPIFPILGAKKVFPKNLAVTHNLIRVSVPPCQNSEKPNDPIPRKQPDRQQGRKMNRPYFIGPFQLPLGVQQIQLQ